MEEDKKKVCEELDKTLLEVMTYLKQLSILRTRYQYAVKEGYFTMSQARYAMGGPSCVSSLQYDYTMKPTVCVTVATNCNSLSSYNDLANYCQTPSNEELQLDFLVKWDSKGKRDGCVAKSGSQHVEKASMRRSGEAIEEVPTDGSGEVPKDPLLWFGVLVPPSLRRSQQLFKQGIEYCAELAATQMKLEVARRKYQLLLVKKAQLTLS